jgi:hypothetical protein
MEKDNAIMWMVAKIAGSLLALWFFFDVKSGGALSTILYLTIAVMLGKLIINNGIGLAIALSDKIVESEMGESFSEKAMRKIVEASQKKVGSTNGEHPDVSKMNLDELRAELERLEKIEKQQQQEQVA